MLKVTVLVLLVGVVIAQEFNPNGDLAVAESAVGGKGAGGAVVFKGRFYQNQINKILFFKRLNATQASLKSVLLLMKINLMPLIDN